MKKAFFIISLLLCIVLVSASSDFDLVLDKEDYSTNQNFQGNIIFDEEEVDITELIEADITDCGSYEEIEISLYDVLVSAGLYSGSDQEYALGSSSTSLEKTFAQNETKLFGFHVEDKVDKINFSVQGSGSGFYLDVGADGIEDWHYVGEFLGWSSQTIYSNTYDSSYQVDGSENFNPKYSVCNDFEIFFDDMSDELLIQVNAVARRDVSEGELIAEIGAEECDLTEGIGGTWSDVSCNVSLDVGNYESPHNFTVCLDSDIDGYWLPKPVGADYYFFTLRKADFNQGMSSSPVYIGGSVLKEKINDYTDDCYSGDCIVPLEMRLTSGGGIILDELVLEHGSILSDRFYELESESVKLNMTNYSIPLDSFSDLKTPNVDELDTCILKIEFDGSSEEVDFDVSPGPIAIIQVSSYYMAKDFDITFDGSDSSSPNEREIVSWDWDFGDNQTDSGQSVTHSYDENGNYNVKLTVQDEDGLESDTNIIIHIVDLEEYLESEFDRVDLLFEDASSFSDSLSGDLEDFYFFMGYSSAISSGEDVFDQLLENYTTVKDSSSENKDTEYARIANNLSDLSKSLPSNAIRVSGRSINGLSIEGPDDVFSYSGITNGTNFQDYSRAVYSFNRDNVSVDFNASLIDVEFFEGEDKFIFVRKSVGVNGGSNNIIVEDLRDVISSLEDVFSSAQEDESTGVIYWNMASSSQEIEYVVRADQLEDVKTIVYSDISLGDVSDAVYCFSYSSGCQRYCGDGSCDIIQYLGVNEKDSANSNYCVQDCVREKVSPWRYIIIFILFVLLLLYLFLYKGPGSFKDLSNKFSYALFHKKLFISERDKMVLSNFIRVSLKRGFKINQIKAALLKKGWNGGQVDYILEKYINKKS